MYEPAEFCRELERLGVDFVTGVPDSTLEGFCNYIYQNPPKGGHVLAHNEGGAVALAAGRYLATGRAPVVYMQNSGLGDAIDPLLSLADARMCAIPMLLLVGWRGEPGQPDEPQHLRMGEVSKNMLECLDLPVGVVTPDFDQSAKELRRAFEYMKTTPGPYVLLVQGGCFTPSPSVPAGYETPQLKREEAIKIIIENLAPTASVVASTGMGAGELFELREALGQPHERDFLDLGAMGHASMIALGVALARPDRRVVCLDGDGALFMHLGAAALIPSLSPGNFIHILLNNGMHASDGGQPDLGAGVDVESLAKACGYMKTARVENPGELRNAVAQCQEETGPCFVEVRLNRKVRHNLGRPTIPPKEMARQFREFLAGSGESSSA